MHPHLGLKSPKLLEEVVLLSKSCMHVEGTRYVNVSRFDEK